MKKYDTGFAVHIGEDSYPIYLIIRENDDTERQYDLICEHEIYAPAWYDVYAQALKDYNDGKLEEVETIK